MRAAFLPYALPSIGEEEIAEVVDSLRSGWLTSGPKVRRLEGELAAYLGARHALAVSSCTAALHIALTALGIGPGDEVVVPTMTFCSTANVVVHLGARPVLVDVGPDLNVTPEVIEAALTPHTRAIVPVHYGGQPCDLEAIHALAARHGLPIVEDAAHAIGARFRDQKIGSDALAAPRSITCFSFYAIKNMTTGEGGAIATADDGLAETMRLLTLHGMSRDAWKRYTGAGSWYYEVVLPGYKDNMTDIQAALGIHQLQKLEGFIETRRRYARLYDEAFVDLPEVEVPIVRPGRCHVYHLYPILLSLERLAIDRAQFIEELRSRGIGTSVHFVPVHLHPFYARQFGYRPGDLPCAEALYSRLISLPLYPAMSVTDVADVIHAVGDVVRAFRL
ncbi:MAG: DegT/DnrJ/EryC1/StrS aminotransferase family protein [Anaerolineaceae bacterium]|nr:DegT/DnrJ/EryC1/StrS aminotransferase family protein [Anaerolineaceae bacterium]